MKNETIQAVGFLSMVVVGLLTPVLGLFMLMDKNAPAIKATVNFFIIGQ